MKEDSVASARYARALFEAASKSDAHAKVEADLGDLVRVLKSSGLQAFLESPSHSPDDKRRAVARVAEMLRSPVSGGLLHLLLKKARIGILSGVLAHYASLWREARGIVQAEFVTAGTPDESFKTTLVQALGRITKKKIELVTKQDPSLVGGFVVRIQNDLIDASVRTRLADLKKQLLETAVN